MAQHRPSGPVRGDPTGRGPRPPSLATVERLPVYQRVLSELLGSGTSTVSSEHLAAAAGVGAAVVRKDLSLFGSFGTRGMGYDVSLLIGELDRRLGGDRDWPLIVVGIGNLGTALVNSEGFRSRGFRVAALFDAAPDVVGTTVAGVQVRHFDELEATVAGTAACIGVVATPPSVAQAVAERLVAVGVRSLLNFAPRVLQLGPGVRVRQVDLSTELQVMSFYELRDEASQL